jgi:hypothetical protein
MTFWIKSKLTAGEQERTRPDASIADIRTARPRQRWPDPSINSFLLDQRMAVSIFTSAITHLALARPVGGVAWLSDIGQKHRQPADGKLLRSFAAGSVPQAMRCTRDGTSRS